MTEIKQALLFLMAAGGLSVIVALIGALWRLGPPPFYPPNFFRERELKKSLEAMEAMERAMNRPRPRRLLKDEAE